MSFANNKDMAVSRARVLEARAQVGATMAVMSPRADGGAAWTNSRPSDNSTRAGSNNLYHIGIDASWEIDLFGRKTDELRANKRMLESQESPLQSAWVSLSAEVAAIPPDCVMSFQYSRQNIPLSAQNRESLPSFSQSARR